jgi:hypothetical protein
MRAAEVQDELGSPQFSEPENRFGEDAWESMMTTPESGNEREFENAPDSGRESAFEIEPDSGNDPDFENELEAGNEAAETRSELESAAVEIGTDRPGSGAGADESTPERPPAGGGASNTAQQHHRRRRRRRGGRHRRKPTGPGNQLDGVSAPVVAEGDRDASETDTASKPDGVDDDTRSGED